MGLTERGQEMTMKMRDIVLVPARIISYCHKAQVPLNPRLNPGTVTLLPHVLVQAQIFLRLAQMCLKYAHV